MLLKKIKSYSINQYVMEDLSESISPAVVKSLFPIDGRRYYSVRDFQSAVIALNSEMDQDTLEEITVQAKVFRLRRVYLLLYSKYNTYFPKSRILPGFWTYLKLSRVVFSLNFRLRAF